MGRLYSGMRNASPPGADGSRVFARRGPGGPSEAYTAMGCKAHGWRTVLLRCRWSLESSESQSRTAFEVQNALYSELPVEYSMAGRVGRGISKVQVGIASTRHLSLPEPLGSARCGKFGCRAIGSRRELPVPQTFDVEPAPSNDVARRALAYSLYSIEYSENKDLNPGPIHFPAGAPRCCNTVLVLLREDIVKIPTHTYPTGDILERGTRVPLNLPTLTPHSNSLGNNGVASQQGILPW